ncbi:hypothetical protein GCM10027082_34270 [Comamonas humi]
MAISANTVRQAWQQAEQARDRGALQALRAQVTAQLQLARASREERQRWLALRCALVLRRSRF